MTDVRIYLFGMPKIEYREQVIKIERRKALALVAFLALHDQPQSRDVAAELLWTDQDEEHARSSLRSSLRALTTPIPVEWIQADRALLGLKPEVVRVNVHLFTDLLAQSRAHDHEPDAVCEQCVELFKQAAALYRSDFLAGFHIDGSAEYDVWQLTQQEWLRREYAGVLRQLSGYYTAAQQHDHAIRYARQWLAVDTLHEPAHRQLIRLYAATGQRSEAVRQYKQCVELLNTELATPPEPETTRLYEAILNNHRLPDETELDRAAAASGGYAAPAAARDRARRSPSRNETACRDQWVGNAPDHRDTGLAGRGQEYDRRHAGARYRYCQAVS